MKKLYILLVLVFIIFILNGCMMNNKLLIFNWGEYINDDFVLLFEEIYGVEVFIFIVDSNELFYFKIKFGIIVYDLVLLGDYMVEKLIKEDLI